MKKSTETHPLVGRYFHTFKMSKPGSRTVQYQGEIIAVAENGVLAQMFSWMGGHDTCQKWFSLAAVTGWDLYASAEAMREVYYDNYSENPELGRWLDKENKVSQTLPSTTTS